MERERPAGGDGNEMNGCFQRRLTTKGHEGTLQEMFCISIAVVVTQMYVFVKLNCTPKTCAFCYMQIIPQYYQFFKTLNTKT